MKLGEVAMWYRAVLNKLVNASNKPLSTQRELGRRELMASLDARLRADQIRLMKEARRRQ